MYSHSCSTNAQLVHTRQKPKWPNGEKHVKADAYSRRKLLDGQRIDLEQLVFTAYPGLVVLESFVGCSGPPMALLGVPDHCVAARESIGAA